MCAKAKKEKSRTANTAVLNHPIAVAQIAKSYNTTGEVVLKLTSDLLEDFNHQEPVFIYFDELPVPFFIQSFTPKGASGAIVKFEGISDFSHSEEIVRKQVFIEAGAVTSNPVRENTENENMAAFLTGQHVYDQSNHPAGIITNYFNYPNNPCIEITPEGKSPFLVPFHENLILEYNAKKKILRMHIPEGLSEL